MRQYIGARYVAKIYENSQNPESAEWEQGSFEPLIVVTFNNGSYISKKFVPSTIGNPAANPTYWTQTGMYNGQIAQLIDMINNINTNLANESDIRANTDNTISSRINNLQTELNNEISTRSNADTTIIGNITNLTNSLNNEVDARASADTSLQNQINQIVAPSGEAPSVAEVENARIGANGVTYPSLGEAIRTQIENLSDKLDVLSEVDTTLFNGYINAAGAFNDNANYHCTDFIPVDDGSYICSSLTFSNSTYRNVSIMGYDKNKQFVQNLSQVLYGMVTSAFVDYTNVLDTVKYVRVSAQDDGNLSSFKTYTYISTNDLIDKILYNRNMLSAKSKLILPASSSVIYAKRNIDNSYDVKIPSSMVVINGVDNSRTFVNLSGTYHIPYNNYLVFDANTTTLSIISDSNLTENDDYTIVLYNSYGILNGMWSVYVNARHVEHRKLTTKFLAHQGSGMFSSDGLGHNLLNNYHAAWEHGFDLAECDVKFTSDNVPVCAHDDTFTDSVTEETVSISAHTFEELSSYNYFGSTIASLDSVVAACKSRGMDLQLDQLSANMTTNQWNAVFDIVRKYRAYDHVIFTVNAVTYTIVQNFYENARLMLLAPTSLDELSANITLANSLVTDKNEVIIAFNYGIGTADVINSYIIGSDSRIKYGAWIIDYATQCIDWLPYVDYITSNKISAIDVNLTLV